MSTLTIVLLLIFVALAIILILAATKPDTFSVRRSARVQAPPERIFPLIDDLRVHESWSPFDKPDPATRKTYSGADTGKGAVYAWHGKGQAGAGRIEITESSPSSRIVMQLDMLKPMKGSNTVVFTLVPTGDATEVTWAMEGSTPYLAKILHVFVNMDRMCGAAFETGLANLKTMTERN